MGITKARRDKKENCSHFYLLARLSCLARCCFSHFRDRNQYTILFSVFPVAYPVNIHSLDPTNNTNHHELLSTTTRTVSTVQHSAVNAHVGSTQAVGRGFVRDINSEYFKSSHEESHGASPLFPQQHQLQHVAVLGNKNSHVEQPKQSLFEYHE